ncbi:MAG: hypothetical protein R6V00_02625 [Candidatus Aminicenantes bacterium]
MKIKMAVLSAVIVLMSVISAQAEIRPQAGVESYLGPNKFFSLTPWAGVRINLTKKSSLLVKYYLHNLQYDYINDLGETVRRKARLNNFTTAVYAQKWGHDFYAAASLFSGTDDYSALALDIGTELRLIKRVAISGGLYYLNEDSILWYPEQESRRIAVYSVKGGFRYTLTDGLSVGPKFDFYKNSEQVNASSLGVLLQFVPKDPVYIHFLYYRYTESAQYKFSGDFFSLGVNLYY